MKALVKLAVYEYEQNVFLGWILFLLCQRQEGTFLVTRRNK